MFYKIILNIKLNKNEFTVVRFQDLRYIVSPLNKSTPTLFLNTELIFF